jgi:DNA-binding transcriptional regulator YbjK
VERLVKKGLAMREDDPADRRVVRVRLTERGVNLVREVMAERNQRLTRVLGALESADREALFRGLGAFIATALRTVDDRTVVEAICLHCGKEHRDDCSVSAALDRPEAQPATS